MIELLLNEQSLAWLDLFRTPLWAHRLIAAWPQNQVLTWLRNRCIYYTMPERQHQLSQPRRISQTGAVLVFRVSPFREMGEARGVLRRFGGDPQRFRATMTELQRRLYAEAA